MPKLVQGNLCDKIVFLSLFLLLNRVLAWTFTEGRWNFNQKQNPKQNQINFYPPFPLFLCLQRKSQRKHSFTIIKKKCRRKQHKCSENLKKKDNNQQFKIKFRSYNMYQFSSAHSVPQLFCLSKQSIV